MNLRTFGMTTLNGIEQAICTGLLPDTRLAFHEKYFTLASIPGNIQPGGAAMEWFNWALTDSTDGIVTFLFEEKQRQALHKTARLIIQRPEEPKVWFDLLAEMAVLSKTADGVATMALTACSMLINMTIDTCANYELQAYHIASCIKGAVFHYYMPTGMHDAKMAPSKISQQLMTWAEGLLFFMELSSGNAAAQKAKLMEFVDEPVAPLDPETLDSIDQPWHA